MASISPSDGPVARSVAAVEIQARGGACRFEADVSEKLLLAGLVRSIGLPYECASGTCGTCKARLLEGRVLDAWPDAPGARSLKPDEILLCQCRPLEDLRLEIRGALRPADPRRPDPGRFAGRIHGTRRLTHDVIELGVRLDRPMAFAPGQFALVRVAGFDGHRGWSMVSHTGEATSTLRFVVKRKPGGLVSGWLFDADPEGAPVDVFGPLGSAIFDPAEDRDLLCIAGGSGIAGMMAILEHAQRTRHFERHRGDVFFGVRSMRDTFYLRELAALREHCGAGLNVVIALSDQAASAAERDGLDLLAFDEGFVHEVAARRMDARLQGVCAFVAGPPPAVDAILRLLLSARVPARNIRYDKFS